MANCNTCPSHSTCSKESTSCGIVNNPANKIKKVIGVMSGKGGVGKSTVSTLIAKQLREQGYKVGIMDADITGPSIPRLLGLKGKRAEGKGNDIYPVETADGIKVISLNLLVENENDPVLWRGPIVGRAVKQFWEDVIWGELDYLVIDMPPGTGDVALTVMQSIPLSGIVMVSIPQDMISMIVAKAVKMANQMNIEILGVVENMSYVVCPGCETKIQLFNGESTEQFLQENNLTLLGDLPMVSSICNISVEGYEKNKEQINSLFNPITTKILEKLNK
ncbi:Mrp/NBP35 family ATP-binding protein [Cetobacterium sp. SF1]|uniref:Mrp/NBP35 family ATP-binding protein n=1 Tax=unclassified Cetobacterium TaxID=2630983 RepID=UPI003CE9223F